MQDQQMERKLAGVLNQWADEGRLPAGVTWQITDSNRRRTAGRSWQKSRLPALAISIAAAVLLLLPVCLLTLEKNIGYAFSPVILEGGAVVVNPTDISEATEYATMIYPHSPAKNEVATELVSGDIECQVYVDANGNYYGSLCQKDHAVNQADSAAVFVDAVN